MSALAPSRPAPDSALAHGPRLIAATAADSDNGWRTELAATVHADEILFAGHYPNFPIFPGVCLIELVRLGAESNPPGGGTAKVRAVRSTRFMSPTYPCDELAISLRWQARESGWRCRAELRTTRGVTATVVLDLTAAAS